MTWAILVLIILLPIAFIAINFIKSLKKKLLPVLIVATDVMLIWLEAILVVIFFKAKNSLDLYQTIDLCSTLSLVAITVWYAIQTYKTNINMREQMFNSHLPKLDIELSRYEWKYTLNNVGAGAAIRPISFFIDSAGNHKDFCPHNTITPNEHLLTRDDATTPHYFSKLDELDEQYEVVAVYRDIYGQCFESSLKVHISKESGVQLEQVRTRKIKENEWQKINEEAQAHKAQEPTGPTPRPMV